MISYKQAVIEAREIQAVFLSTIHRAHTMLVIGMPCSFVFWGNYFAKGNDLSLVLAVCASILSGCGAYKWAIAKDGYNKAGQMAAHYERLDNLFK